MTLIGNRAFTDVISLNSAGLAWALSSSTGVFYKTKIKTWIHRERVMGRQADIGEMGFQVKECRYCQQLLIAWRKTWAVLLQSHILISNFQPAISGGIHFCYVKLP